MRKLSAKALATTALVTAMLAAPLPFELGASQLGITAAHAAKPDGKGKGAEKSQKSNNGDKDQSAKGKPASSDDSTAAEDETGEKVHGNGNIHAKLAGLNSLNRNINGLMNSSDPRMVDIRSFI